MPLVESYEGGALLKDDKSTDQDENSPDPNLFRVRWRWTALVLTACFVVGCDFCYDSPAFLEQRILDRFQIDESQYSILYTI